MSANTTSTGTISQSRAMGGFAQRVIDPLNPSITTPSQYNSSIQVTKIDIIFSTTAYLVYLPDGAFIKEIGVIPTSSFSTGSTMNVGKTIGASDLLSAIDITQQSISILASPVLDSQLFRNQVQNVRPVFVTLTGTLSSGAGYILVEYLNTK